MESDMPIELVAARLWNGTKWHYPNAERMVEENKRLRAEVAALKKADPLADYQEQVASIVYAAMRFDREDVTPEWQCGNSHAEYRAQQAATEIAEMLRCALKADLAQRTAERDEARREVCFAYGPMAEALAAAKRRGWDCFEEAK